MRERRSPPANPLWRAAKVKNYLPDMTHPEVADLLTRSDVVIIPLPAIEQHGPQMALGTDFYIGVAHAQLIAQQTDALVAPIIMAGNSPYHLGFPGTISLSTATLQAVYFEAVQSLLHHGFRKFLLFASHGGNVATTKFVVDRINQETPGVAVDLLDAVGPFLRDVSSARKIDHVVQPFDRHAGVAETSVSLYLTPTLVQMDKAPPATPLTLPPHLRAMLPVLEENPTARLLFLAETLKAKATGKHTSTKEMISTGCWSEDDIRTATAEIGKEYVDGIVTATVKFIDEWKRLVPMVKS